MSSSLAALAVLFGLGCGPSEQPQPSQAPAVVPARPVVLFEDASFFCCGNDRVRRLVSEYVDLQQALAFDDLARAQAEVHAARGVALAAAEDVDLSGHSRGIARQVASLFEPVAQGSLEQIRGVFSQVSNKLVVLAQANPGGAMRIAVATCNKSNANWLQSEAAVQNPYLGALDLSSGAFRP